MIERLLERNSIDTAPWLADGDLAFVQALIIGAPPSHESCSSSSSSSVYRTGQAGVLGEDKRFLYDIVANQRNGFDVDKLDYFERDSHYAGVVKVSFDRVRLMSQARVALVEEEGGGPLQICWPEKCTFEVLQCYQTRFSLHAELYQHRVTAAIQLMVTDALLLADDDAAWRIYGRGGTPLRMSECGTEADEGLDGFVQLTDAIVPMIMYEATRAAAASSSSSSSAAAHEEEQGGLAGAAALLQRVQRRQLYRFVGSALMGDADRGKVKIDLGRVADELVEASGGRLDRGALRLDVRHVHFGCKERNPLDSIAFFDNKKRKRSVVAAAAGAGADGEAEPPPHGGGLLRAQRRQIPPARLPGAFQERSIRIFVTDAEYEPAAREALAAWCEQDACVDGCEVAYE